MAEKNKNLSVRRITFDWWRDHCQSDAQAGYGNARKFRAACRRLRSPLQAYTLGETVALHRALAKAGYGEEEHPTIRVGMISALLGQFGNLNEAPVAAKMGGNPPAVTPLRFQTLIRSDRAALMAPLRRALTQIKFECDPTSLASDVYYWGDDVKARWCLQYYGDTQPLQTATTTPEETSA